MSEVRCAVIGGGFAGTLLAVQLVQRGARVIIIERSPRLARGVAYSTPYPEHLLNVPAARMSAFPDRPDHFAEWFEEREQGRPSDFAERRVYGSYLQEQLAQLQEEAGERLRIVEGEAVDVVHASGAETLRLRSGATIEADQVILALGNLEPDVPNEVPPELRRTGIYVADPWAEDISTALKPEDLVLLLGTGLTAIDAALSLERAAFGGHILAISRRGLTPRAHASPPTHAHGLSAAPDLRGAALVRFVRREAERIGWRAAVDQLRPVTQPMWAAAPVRERRQFLRHLRPWWDVHRHRIPASVAAEIDGMEQDGRIAFAAGKIVSMSITDGGAMVEWRQRGSSRIEKVKTARIVNCTGPQMDISRAGDELLDRLMESGRIRPDPCRIGIDVDRDWRTLDRSGEPSNTVHAVGPMTRGSVWEMVAVPDIRKQVQDLASRLAT